MTVLLAPIARPAVSADDIHAAGRRLKKAKIDLMRTDKFALLSGLMMVGNTYVDENIPTACTNGRDDYYGVEFIKKLTDKELRFVVAHETGHKMFRHMTTWEKLVKLDSGLANQAMDHVVNLLLKEIDPTEDLIAMPVHKDGPLKGHPMGLADPQFKGMHTKQVFDILRKQEEGESGGDGEGEGESGSGEAKGRGEGRGNGGHGGFDEHDHESGKGLTPKEQQELERDIDQAIRQGVIAASRSRNANGAGNALLTVEELLRPKVDWRAVLREFVKLQCAGRDTSSWRRPNRRLLGEDIYMPSMSSEKVESLVLAIDTSGSIGTKELTAVLSEVQGIAEEVKPEAVHVLYWDTAVVSHEEYQGGAVAMITQSTRPVGGGGTAPSCVPRFLKDKGIKPECVIVFTDGEVGNDWGNDWPAPTLWLIKNNRRGIVAGHGQTIYMEDE